MKVYLQNPPTIRIGGQVTKSLYQFSMQSPDKKSSTTRRDKLEEGARRRAGRGGCDQRRRRSRSPQVNVTIDRDKARRWRQRQPDRERALRRLRPALGLHHLRAGQRIQGLLELEPQYQADPRALSLLYFKARRSADTTPAPDDTPSQRTTTPPADMVQRRDRRPARHAGHTSQDTGPQTINHYGQLPAATISFNLKPGAALGSVVDRRAGNRRTHAARHHQHRSSRARPKPSRARWATSGCC